MRFLVLLAACLSFAFYLYTPVSFATAPTESTTILPMFQFEEQASDLQYIKIAQRKAVEENKYLLVILGATWCSDSKVIADQFSQPDFYEQISQHYEVVTVNVGYLESGYDIARFFGLPTYYGTPTVLIVEPSSSTITNRIDFYEWMNARSKSQEDFHSYFLQQKYPKTEQLSLSLEVKKEIEIYETLHAQRINAGYIVAGELLKAYKESGQPASKKFTEVWIELAKYRNAVAKAVGDALRTGNTAQLPQFENSFSWENQ
ncbi:hypothetical protein CWI82_00920 [Pseudidiomarina tainanensis]|uniref:Uncharacterized protein n=1 Tax=Pseudidiomarina tainanensis TaxID=502365 RepID=A0ACD2HHY4_9GAMM|nr:thioredoxin family protein [Pseudidiomarina tainanensis]RZQ55909.1 hypothetical protein CWI82_00920 [Pseudidiomarina tainanensis]